MASLSTSKQCRLLAKLNIQRQIYELLDVPLAGNKIDDKAFKVSGLIYNRDTAVFEPVTLNV
ncbi:MAG: hypothetical protein EOP45_02280 [Sphingobacteriaceae bacterium]|nr:MAG: hypothetical protein EOP45_02280 [Sphingobacteriaceae bacterium]